MTQSWVDARMPARLASIDEPAALAAVLAAGVKYLGAMGSRRTQTRRREWLTANGVPADRIDAVHGPADCPAET